MGNRAVIAFENMPEVGIYLHWNGGPESVLAFLEETKRRGVRDPADDALYSFARLTQTIAEFFTRGGGLAGYQLSIGVGPLSQLDTDNGNNGTYWVGEGFRITRREHAHNGAAMVPESLTQREREQYQGMLEDMEAMRVQPSE